MKPGLKYHLLCLILTGLLVFQETSGQAARYSHPLYDISFEATANWQQVLQEVNGREFRVTHPNQNMSIGISYVPDCRNPKRYMKRISGQMGLISTMGQDDTLINGRAALMLRGCCVQGKRPYRFMVMGFPVDKGLYLVEISCPEECSAGHRERVHLILGTLRVGSSI